MIKANQILSTIFEFLVNRLKNAGRSLRETAQAAQCPLCHADSNEAHGFCAPCWKDLPWNNHACIRCALPLPLTAQREETARIPGQEPAIEFQGAPLSQLPQDTCHACRAKPPSFGLACSAWVYTFPTNSLLHAFKYGGKRFLLKPISGALIHHINRLDPKDRHPEALIPVPMTEARKRLRGIDHSGLLTSQLARSLNLKLDAKLLIKTRDTESQAKLSKQDRIRNLTGSFALTYRPIYKHVAIVDDVLTTTATAETLAKLLKKAGVERVDIWSIARTLKAGQT